MVRRAGNDPASWVLETRAHPSGPTALMETHYSFASECDQLLFEPKTKLTYGTKVVYHAVHMGRDIMPFWYTIEEPRNQPCWEVNPKLWESFTKAMLENHGFVPERNILYTEQYVVQRMDVENESELWDGHET